MQEIVNQAPNADIFIALMPMAEFFIYSKNIRPKEYSAKNVPPKIYGQKYSAKNIRPNFFGQSFFRPKNIVCAKMIFSAEDFFDQKILSKQLPKIEKKHP